MSEFARWASLVDAVSLGAQEAMREAWPPPRFPDWAQFVSDRKTVCNIFRVVLDLIEGEGIEAGVIFKSNAEEYVYYWRECFNQNFFAVWPQVNPDPSEFAIVIARRLAGGIISVDNNQKTYHKFLKEGIPAGLPFPEYNQDRSKMFEREWGDIQQTSCSHNHHIMLHSKLSKLPARSQSLRSSNHNISDTDRPELFT